MAPCRKDILPLEKVCYHEARKSPGYGRIRVTPQKEVSGMISFLLCLAILVGGYFVYGKIVDNTFGPDDRETPAVRINDGVDHVVMPQ